MAIKTPVTRITKTPPVLTGLIMQAGKYVVLPELFFADDTNTRTDYFYSNFLSINEDLDQYATGIIAITADTTETVDHYYQEFYELEQYLALYKTGAETTADSTQTVDYYWSEFTNINNVLGVL